MEETFPKIIWSMFDSLEEGRLFEDLKGNKGATGWTFKNDKDKLVPTRETMSWHKSNNYKELNDVTEEYHYLLLFIDKIFKRIIDHEFHWYIDRHSIYDQIVIDPD